MQIDRRRFLKYCIGSAALLGLDLSVIGALEKAFSAGKGPAIIWLNGANCTGCTVSLANLVGTDKPADVAELLLNTINLAFHPNLMGAAGALAVDNLRKATEGDYVLAIDGGIPTAFGGNTCMLWTENDKEVNAMDAVKELAPKAKAVLCVGTCASFGGIPAGNSNPTKIKSVQDIIGTSTINIPGCPTHPDWVVSTIARLLAGNTIRLDSFNRPRDLFSGDSRNVHEQCPRNDNNKALNFGVDGGCLQYLGCKGPLTQGDCPTRKWNNGTNWCVGANSICLGCTESGFPDAFLPFYATALPSDHPQINEGESCSSCHGDGSGGDDGGGSELPPNHRPIREGQSCSSCHGDSSGGSDDGYRDDDDYHDDDRYRDDD